MSTGNRNTDRRPLFSVTKDDCVMQTFCVGGPGGGGKDTSNTGVRWTHPPSGAVGVGREERSQKANKERAFRRMAATPEFQKWVRIEAARRMGQAVETPEQIMERVDRQIANDLSRGLLVIEEI